MKWYRRDTNDGPRWTTSTREYNNSDRTYIVDERLLSEDKVAVAVATADLLNKDYELLGYGSPGVTYMDACNGEVKAMLPEEMPPPGQYRWDGNRDELIPIVKRKETPVDLHSGIYKEMIDYINTFLGARGKYANIGAHYHSGCLMYGPPGTGKSTLIRQVLERRTDVLCLWTQYTPGTGLCEALSILPFPKIVIMEEITNIDQRTLLPFLDGEKTIDSCLMIATTNYPQKLASNLLDRPSRFDKLFEVGIPGEDQRREFLSMFKTLTPNDVSVAVLLSKGYSLDYLRELILLKEIHGLTVSAAHGMVEDRKKAALRISKMPLTSDSAWDRHDPLDDD